MHLVALLSRVNFGEHVQFTGTCITWIGVNISLKLHVKQLIEDNGFSSTQFQVGLGRKLHAHFSI